MLLRAHFFSVGLHSKLLQLVFALQSAAQSLAEATLLETPPAFSSPRSGLLPFFRVYPLGHTGSAIKHRRDRRGGGSGSDNSGGNDGNDGPYVVDD